MQGEFLETNATKERRAFLLLSVSCVMFCLPVPSQIQHVGQESSWTKALRDTTCFDNTVRLELCHMITSSYRGIQAV